MLIHAEQVALGSTQARLVVHDKTRQDAAIKLVASLYDGERLITSEEFSGSLCDGSFDFELSAFGEWELAVVFLHEQAEDTHKLMLALRAKEYHFALFLGTTPVFLFALRYVLDQIPRISSDGSPAPAILGCQHKEALMWDRLFEGMYQNPFTHTRDEGEGFYERGLLYLKMLMNMDKDAQFFVYITDMHITLFLLNLLEDLPYVFDRCELRFLSDGDATHYRIEQWYSQNNLYSVPFEKRRASFEEALDSTIVRSKTSWLKNETLVLTSPVLALALLDRFPNSEWWILARMDKDAPSYYSDEELWEYVCSNEQVLSFDFLELLACADEAGVLTSLEALFGFDASVVTKDFSQDAICFVGGITYKQFEGALECLMEEELAYIRAFVASCAQDVPLYYKPHPGRELDEYARNQMQALGIRILDYANVPLELILYRNRSLKLAGSPSSIFLLPSFANRIVGIFTMTRKQCKTSTFITDQVRSVLLANASFYLYLQAFSKYQKDAFVYMPSGFLLGESEAIHPRIYIEPSDGGCLMWDINKQELLAKESHASFVAPAFVDGAHEERKRVAVGISAANANNTLIPLVSELISLGFSEFIILDQGEKADTAFLDHVRAELDCSILRFSAHEPYSFMFTQTFNYINGPFFVGHIGIVFCEGDGSHNACDIARAADLLLDDETDAYIGEVCPSSMSLRQRMLSFFARRFHRDIPIFGHNIFACKFNYRCRRALEKVVCEEKEFIPKMVLFLTKNMRPHGSKLKRFPITLGKGAHNQEVGLVEELRNIKELYQLLKTN